MRAHGVPANGWDGVRAGWGKRCELAATNVPRTARRRNDRIIDRTLSSARFDDMFRRLESTLSDGPDRLNAATA